MHTTVKKDSGTKTFEMEDRCSPPFIKKAGVSVERGVGVYVYDENGRRYLDFTSGWGVTSLGHTHPVILNALAKQSRMIMQNPDSGTTYSPARARLLELMREILPHGLTKVFFASSGAEANDAALKLARKASGKKNVVSAAMSFHGRTIGATSATGQSSHRDKFAPLVPNHIIVPYNDIAAVESVIGDDVAAVIVEPVQGEGGVRVPDEEYLPRLSQVCKEHGVYLILDEVQTGFFRTGPVFASSPYALTADFMTMGKGIAGGFPFAGFALSGRVSHKLAAGDHGGTYCGNPLGCAVAHAVIRHMLDNDIGGHVQTMGAYALKVLQGLKCALPELIADVRGKGLLLALEFGDPVAAKAVQEKCLERGLFVNVTQGSVLRIFPALNIAKEELGEGLNILKKTLTEHA